MQLRISKKNKHFFRGIPFANSVAISALVLALNLIFPRPSYAFLLLSGGGFAKGARPVSSGLVWTAREVVFQVNTDLNAYHGSNSASITAEQFLNAATAGVNAWLKSCNANLTIKLVGTTSTLDSGSDGTNVITFDNRTTVQGNTFGNSTETLAAAFSTLSGTDNLFSDCDIVVNGNFSGTFGVNGEGNKYDLISTLTHEVGHCLGLDHPVEPPTITSSNQYLYSDTMVQTAVAGVGSTFRRDINQDDKDGVECLYQYGKDFRNGNYCSSYHGTNGGGAISGRVSGGATADRDLNTCGNYDARANTAVTKALKASGCITDAFASDRSDAARSDHARTKSNWNFQDGSWLFSMAFTLLVFFILRFLMPVIIAVRMPVKISEKARYKKMKSFSRIILGFFLA